MNKFLTVARSRSARRALSSLLVVLLLAGALVVSLVDDVARSPRAGALSTFGPISSLSLSNSTLSEQNGSPYTYNGTAIARTATSTDLTATFASGTATWSRGGSSGSLTSGAAATVPLVAQMNDITVVHDDGGTTTTYTVHVFRGVAMSGLVFSTPGLTMTPAFDPEVHEYTLSDVPYSTSTLSYVVSHPMDSAGWLDCDHCDWWQYQSRNTQTMWLSPGANTITWYVREQNPYGAADSTYVLHVNRGYAFESSRLVSLTSSAGTLTERNGQLYNFDIPSVSRTTSSIDLTATFSVGTASWSANGSTGSLTSGVAAAVPLVGLMNDITIAHVDGATTTNYHVFVFRGVGMSGLVFSTPGLTMTPAFDPAVHEYTLSDVPYSTSTLSYVASHPGDSAGWMECDHCDWWQYQSRGTQTMWISPGANTITWYVREQNQYGAADSTYVLHVNRGYAFDSNHLESMSLSTGALTEQNGVTYVFNAPRLQQPVSSTDLTVAFSVGTATWTNGASSGTLTSGEASTVPLAEGANSIRVEHVNGATTTTYTINQFRGQRIGNISFAPSSLAPTPVFDPSVHTYSLGSVPYEQSTLSYTVQVPDDQAGWLDCSHCDWWVFQARGTMTLTLQPGTNCIDFAYRSIDQYGGPDHHYVFRVDRGTPTQGVTCLSLNDVPTTTTTTSTSTTSTSTTSTTTTSTSTTSTSTTSTTTTSTSTSTTSTSTTSTTSTSVSTTSTTLFRPSTTVAPVTEESVRSIPAVIIDPNLTRIAPGRLVRMRWSGFVPRERVRLYVASEPVLLGEEIADENGEVEVEGQIPFDLEPGTHSLVLASDSGVAVRQTVALATSDLPATGTNSSGLVRLAVIVTLTGAVLTFAARRRRARA